MKATNLMLFRAPNRSAWRPVITLGFYEYRPGRVPDGGCCPRQPGDPPRAFLRPCLRVRPDPGDGLHGRRTDRSWSRAGRVDPRSLVVELDRLRMVVERRPGRRGRGTDC